MEGSIADEGGTIGDPANTQNCRLRRIDDRREDVHAKHTERGDVEGAARAGPHEAEGKVDEVLITDDAAFSTKFQADLLGGITLIEGETFNAIPYYAWAHRGKGPMAVWISR